MTVWCTGCYPAAWREKWTPSGSSITLAASYATEKMKKGETNGKANQLHKKKKSCHLSNIHCSLSLVFFFFLLPAAHNFEIEFWKPYTLLTAFMLYQFTAFFLPSFSFSMWQNLTNSLFLASVLYLIQHIKGQCHIWNSTGNPFKFTMGEEKEREQEKNQASTALPV